MYAKECKVMKSYAGFLFNSHKEKWGRDQLVEALGITKFANPFQESYIEEQKHVLFTHRQGSQGMQIYDKLCRFLVQFSQE